MAKQTAKSNTSAVIANFLAVQGVIVALFGALALFWPGLTATVFISLFGAFVIVWGLIGLVHSFLRLGRSRSWWVELVFSVLALGLGAFLLFNPAVTGQIIILLVGLTLIARGLMDLITGLFTKEPAIRRNRSFYSILGLLSVIAGIVVALYPATSGLVFVGIFGFYLLLYGVLSVVLAFRVRRAR